MSGTKRLPIDKICKDFVILHKNLPLITAFFGGIIGLGGEESLFSIHERSDRL